MSVTELSAAKVIPGTSTLGKRVYLKKKMIARTQFTRKVIEFYLEERNILLL